MNLFKKLTSRSQFHTKEQSILTSVFSYAGISFLSVCAIGFAVWGMIASSGLLKVLGNGRFNWDIYRQIASQNPSAVKTIGYLSMIGGVLIILSFILRIFWIFRFDRVSKPFIYTVYASFIIGQGVGFGFLFASWNAPDLIAIFGITGGLFAVMAITGYFAKNLRGMIPFLVVGGLAVFVLAMINTILYASGIYNDKLTFLFLTLSGIMAFLYIMFDVWWIKRTNDSFSQAAFMDKDDRFRLVAFFAFQLLTDFIWLLWTVARIYARIRK